MERVPTWLASVESGPLEAPTILGRAVGERETGQRLLWLTWINAGLMRSYDHFTMRVSVATAAIPKNNQLLAALPAEAWDRLVPNLRLISLSRGAMLYAPGEPPRHAYFPVNAVVALLHVLANGAPTEISLVGNEGLVGIIAVLGGESNAMEAVVLSAGFAYELPMQQLKSEFNRGGAMLRLLLWYVQSLMTQVAQTAVCNRFHSIEQQICSRLLFAFDSLHRNQLAVTQEMMADMLGVRRETVTKVAHMLQKAGVLEYSRGRVTVLDRSKLEQRACECFTVVKKAAQLQSKPIGIKSSRPAPRGFRRSQAAGLSA